MARGYFSPQNYVSVSLPVSLTEKYDNWTMKLGGSVGYQSYSQDKSAYFPTNSEWQQTLETAVSNGFAKEAYYSATSKSGIGYTLRAGADYKVNKQMTLGARLAMTPSGIITKVPPGSISAICWEIIDDDGEQ